ncbi:MAG TPA: chemotaxis protein CheD [bacterium]|nr:chemotaxis protein CheD [bacterium]HPN43205.1 chemotaxis protein CheD [bacterium]
MKRIVGIADMIISTDPNDTLITYALGSCLGITIYDPLTKIGALLHVMLPQSSIDPGKAAKNPYMFVDTGLDDMFAEFEKKGGAQKRMIVKVAGGASFKKPGENDLFEIGKRNFTMFRKVLWKKGILLKAYDVGGAVTRNISIDLNNGAVSIRIEGVEKSL